MRLLRHLTGRHRTTSTNRTLGLLLAFNALSLPTSPPFLETIQPSRHPGLELL